MRQIMPIFIGMLETNEKSWIELWNGLVQFDLALFEPAGICKDKDTGNSIGLDELIGLREYFEGIELYRRAGHVHELIQEYRRRWPTCLSKRETAYHSC